MADIEHKDLPDSLLHEPKGTATATKNTTYMADGNGSGTYRKVKPTDLDITERSITPFIPSNISNTAALDSEEIDDTANGILEPVSNEYDIATMNAINHNMSELARLHTNQSQINSDIKSNILTLYTSVERIYNYLKVNGFLS